MKATMDLPANYQHFKTLDLSSPRTALWLNLAAVPLLLLYGWLFSRIIDYLRALNPSAKGTWGLFTAFSGLGVVALILSIIFMLVFHELIHGAFFWIFTGEQPKFALKAAYAYAAAPDCYLPRIQYAIVGLSPLFVISILSVISATFISSTIVPYLIYIATFNAAGALGDLVVVAWVLRQSPLTVIQDKGDKYISFKPDNE
jgi:Putative zincin peptidase